MNNCIDSHSGGFHSLYTAMTMTNGHVAPSQSTVTKRGKLDLSHITLVRLSEHFCGAILAASPWKVMQHAALNSMFGPCLAFSLVIQLAAEKKKTSWIQHDTTKTTGETQETSVGIYFEEFGYIKQFLFNIYN